MRRVDAGGPDALVRAQEARLISRQGWLLTIAYAAIAVTLGATLASSQGWLFATLLIIVTALVLLVVYLTKD